MFLITVLIHEFGHLLCGLISGWKFEEINIFGFSAIRKERRIRFEYRGGFPGYCRMREGPRKRGAVFLLLGGSLFNIFAALVFLTALIRLFHNGAALMPIVILSLIVSLNTAIGITSLWRLSPESDGSKLYREVYKQKNGKTN